MDLVKQWSASLCYEQAEFSGRVTLSCSVNNNQSYRLSVLLQYNLLTHCEQFKYPNLIIILKINYLSCHRCSPTPPPHKTPNRSKAWFVSGYEMDHFLVTMVPGKKGVRRVTFPGHCISVTCTAAEHHRGGKCKKKSCRPNVYLAMQSPFHGYGRNFQIDGIQSLRLNVLYN